MRTIFSTSLLSCQRPSQLPSRRLPPLHRPRCISFRLQLTVAGDEDACSVALDIVYDFSDFLDRNSDASSHNPQLLLAHIKVCHP